jgi:predicted dehydrogenase
MRELEGGGGLLHDGTHLIDLLFFLFGGPIAVKSVAARWKCGIDSQVTALLTGPGRLPIIIETGGERGFFEFRLEIEGRQGMIRVGNSVAELWGVAESSLYSGFTDLVRRDPWPTELSPAENGPWGFAGPFGELDRAMKIGNVSPLSSLADGVAALELIHRIYRAGQPRKFRSGKKQESGK